MTCCLNFDIKPCLAWFMTFYYFMKITESKNLKYISYEN